MLLWQSIAFAFHIRPRGEYGTVKKVNKLGQEALKEKINK